MILLGIISTVSNLAIAAFCTLVTLLLIIIIMVGSAKSSVMKKLKEMELRNQELRDEIMALKGRIGQATRRRQPAGAGR